MTPLSQRGLCLLFLFSVGIGAFLGAVYDCFRILRVAFPMGRGREVSRSVRVLERTVVFFEDIIYALFASVTVNLFLFNLNDGQFRIFTLIGSALGFFVWYCTVGRIIMRCANAIVAFIRRVLSFFLRLLVWPVLRLVCKLCRRVKKKLAVFWYRIQSRRTERKFLSAAEREFRIL